MPPKPAGPALNDAHASGSVSAESPQDESTFRPQTHKFRQTGSHSEDGSPARRLPPERVRSTEGPTAGSPSGEGTGHRGPVTAVAGEGRRARRAATGRRPTRPTSRHNRPPTTGACRSATPLDPGAAAHTVGPATASLPSGTRRVLSGLLGSPTASGTHIGKDTVVASQESTPLVRMPQGSSPGTHLRPDACPFLIATTTRSAAPPGRRSRTYRRQRPPPPSPTAPKRRPTHFDQLFSDRHVTFAALLAPCGILTRTKRGGSRARWCTPEHP
ncbi:hypothetical protein ACVWXU_006067 [Streptomyces sp. TE33382]